MAQTGPKFRTHSFQETFSFLFVRVHLVRGIASQFIEFLDVFPNSLGALFQGHELTKLNLNHTRGDMMSPKSCTELRPRDWQDAWPERSPTKRGQGLSADELQRGS